MESKDDDNVIPFHSPKRSKALEEYVERLYDLSVDAALDDGLEFKGNGHEILTAYKMNFMLSVFVLKYLGETKEELGDIIRSAFEEYEDGDFVPGELFVENEEDR